MIGQPTMAAPEASLTERWNLADLYASLDAWNADAARLTEQMAEFGLCKGKLGTSAVSLRDALDLRADMIRRLYRLGLFSSEQLAQDTSVADSLALDQRCERLAHQLDEATAFVSPEILALGAAAVEAFIAAEPGAADPPPPAGAHPARRAAHAGRRGRGAGRPLRPDERRGQAAHTAC